MKEWQFQDAEAQFEELVSRCQTHGPQAIVLAGERVAVVMSATEYGSLARPFESAADVLLAGPEWPVEMLEAIEPGRSRELPRDIDL